MESFNTAAANLGLLLTSLTICLLIVTKKKNQWLVVGTLSTVPGMLIVAYAFYVSHDEFLGAMGVGLLMVSPAFFLALERARTTAGEQTSK